MLFSIDLFKGYYEGADVDEVLAVIQTLFPKMCKQVWTEL